MKKLCIFLLAVVSSVTTFAQVDHNRQGPLNDNSFNIVLLGDPQSYTKFDYNQPIFDMIKNLLSLA